MWWDGVNQGSYQRIRAFGEAPVREGIPTLRINSGWNMLTVFDNINGWNALWSDPDISGFVYVNDIVVSDSYIGPDYRVTP